MSALMERLPPTAQALEREVNQIVALRLREFRVGAGMSQTELADQLGVSFQQVQKYESGANRVSAPRLAAIARALGRPVDSFFPSELSEPMPERPVELGGARRAIELTRAFHGLAPEVQAALVRLARSLAGDEEAAPC